MGKNKKQIFKEIKQYFEDQDCELYETEYINCKTKMRYRCSCGNTKCKIRLDSFKRGNRCKKCAGKRIGDKKRFKFEEVRQYFEDQNCELLETEYISSQIKMRYRCKCGNTKCKICFSNFKMGKRCIECSGCKKYTLEDVQQYFEDNNCKLLATEYIGAHTPMKYECSCGNSDCKISFSSFKQGHRCMRCSGKEKPTFEFVYNYFKERDCLLLETEYKNAHAKMKYRCKCGNKKCKINFSKFKSGQRCRECSGCEKHTFEEVYEYFEDHDCKLLETEYINRKTKMRYECKCGNEYERSFNDFKKSTIKRCKECINKKLRKERQFTFEYVYDYFEDYDCELLETEYKNIDTKMRFKCSCTNTDETTFYRFQKRKKCKKCILKEVSGENHYNYNPNLTDEEREKGRICLGHGKWRKDILKQDNNTCQCCFEIGGKLIAHHIESYGDNKELRIIISNGITLCEEHHIEFHKKYGYGNNNRKQLEEFLISFVLYT